MNSRNKIFFGLGLFFLVSLAGLYFALQAWMPFMWILLVAGISSLLFVGIQERALIGEFTQLKTTKHGLSMGSVLFLTLAILGFLNYFSVKFVHVFDYSMTGQYTLSEQTKKILDHLDSNLEIKYFYKEGLQGSDQYKKAFLNMSKIFEVYSNKIKISSVEMNSNPSMTELFGATKGTGEAFVSYKGKMNRIEPQFTGITGFTYTEPDFTNAIIKTTREKFKNIYFIQGHGEKDIEDEKDEKSLAAFKKALEKNSYMVNPLNLITTGSIPENADLLILGGATQSYQKSEMTLLNNYLSLGKPVLVLFDAMNIVGPATILDLLGWKISHEFVFNILTTQNGPMVATDQPTVANSFSESNDITRFFGTTRSALFFRPHPLVPQATPKKDIQGEPLVMTSNQTVALDKISTTDYTGKPQSFTLGAVFKGAMNAVVFSDVNVASNQFFNQTSNKDLLLNSVSYLAKETDLIALAPKEPALSKIKMAGPEFNSYFKYIIVGLFFPMPIVFLILSLTIWFRRRHA